MGDLTRRSLLAGLGGAAVLSAGMGRARAQARSAEGRVVIIGGGFAGATCAKYLRRASPRLEVTLIEREPRYLTCPLSNTVVAGLNPLDRLAVDYGRLVRDHGIRLVSGTAVAVDPAGSRVTLEDGRELSYDRLVVAPGIDMRFDALEGYDRAASELLPHAWKAGPQTLLLERQLDAMPDGGVVIITVPPMPYRCPPGPYERASLIAYRLQRQKPRSKVLILDANDSFPKQPLFQDGWAALYPGMIEWVSGSAGGRVSAVEPKARTVIADGTRHQGDVVNVIPPERAGAIAAAADLTDDTGWCPVEPRALVSRRHEAIHVIGDAAAAGLPMSGTLANTEAKVCAAAVAALLRGEPVGDPFYVNACYSLLAPEYGISITMTFEAEGGQVRIVEGSKGSSPRAASARYRAKEAKDAHGWYASIVADSFH